MTKFKVGDAVERNLNAGDADRFLRQIGPGPHLVTSVSPSGKWLGINGWVDDIGDIEPWHAGNFTRVEEQDDPLPPAPESALYVNKWRWGVGVRNLGDEVQIGTGNPNSCNHGWVYATLDPDAALQLAHDLNRMANEIKRKEKQQ